MWIECKGRKGTVEPDEVKSAANNALGIDGLDYLVITTDTQLSDPTETGSNSGKSIIPDEESETEGPRPA